MSSNESVGACGTCGSLSPWRCGCPGNSQDTWRERMYDLAASVWTARKAAPNEIRDEIRAATGAEVPEEQEDALRDLSDQEVQKVLVGLAIPFEQLDKGGCFDTELCPECFAMPGECEPTCGQYDGEAHEALYDPPSSEQGVVELLEEALTERLSDLCGGRTEPRWRIRSYEETGLMTSSKGLVLELGGREFQLTVVRSK